MSIASTRKIVWAHTCMSNRACKIPWTKAWNAYFQLKNVDTTFQLIASLGGLSLVEIKRF